MKKIISFLCAALMLLLSVSVVVTAEPDADYYNRTIAVDAVYEDGAVSVSLVDSEGGTMSSWPVSLIVNGETVMTENTDYDGTVIFEYDFSSEDDVVCRAHDGGFDEYSFTGTEQKVDVEAASEPTQEETTDTSEEYEDTTTYTEETTTTFSDTVTTTAPSVNTTTSTVSTMMQSAVTTAVNGDKVAVGMDADRAFLTVVKLTADEFLSKARMWMDASIYNEKIDSDQATLHLQLTVNEQAGDISKLVAAKNAPESPFASFDDTDVRGFAVDMNVVYIDGATRVPIPFPDGEYLLEIPVPLTMKNCKKIAVAACTSNGVSTLTEVPVKNGVIVFNVTRFQTMAIVGLGDRGVVLASLTQTPALLWVFIAIGVLLILGGILLLIFVSFRRKADGVVAKNQSNDLKEEASNEPTPFVLEEDPVIREEENIAVSVKTEEPISAPVPSEPAVEVAPAVEAAPQVQTESSMPRETVAPKTTLQEDHSLDDMLDDMLNDLDDMI